LVKNKPASCESAPLSQVVRRATLFLLPWGRRRTTLAILLVAVAMALVTWDYYVTAPWTRDGRVRVLVASIAPEVSGRITELRVADNQFVHEGDVLYVIDPFDFEVAVRSDKALLQLLVGRMFHAAAL
jgi:multidrug resistance efflux pump